MREAIAAEWTKLRTRASTHWLLFGVVALTMALSAAAEDLLRAVPDLDPTRLSLSGVALGQAVVAALAVLAIGGEYDTGLIRVTLVAMPRRLTVMAARAAIVGALTWWPGQSRSAAGSWSGGSSCPPGATRRRACPPCAPPPAHVGAMPLVPSLRRRRR